LGLASWVVLMSETVQIVIATGAAIGAAVVIARRFLPAKPAPVRKPAKDGPGCDKCAH